MKFFILIIIFSLFVTPFFDAVADTTDSERAPILLAREHQEKGYKVALFAGGCFWCLEPPFEVIEGVVDVSVGYCGGSKENASYYRVSGGATNHLETVRIVYDPQRVSYTKLLDIFWRFIDPTDPDGQYDDRGPHYSTAIFYEDNIQKQAAEISMKTLADSAKHSKPIATRILPAAPFYLAEERHQNFYEKQFPSSKTIQ